MAFIKSVLLKLGSGVLYGVGFLIGISLVGMLILPHFRESVVTEQEEKIDTWFIEYDENANLKTKVNLERIDTEEFTLLGVIENGGDKTWSSVTLKAELYDSKGNFVEQCEEYVNQISKPGTSINFKLSCSGKCSPLQLQNYNSYKLVITDARYKRV